MTTALRACKETPAGIHQRTCALNPRHLVSQEVRSFDTFEVVRNMSGSATVFAGNGTASDIHGAAFYFTGDKLNLFGARVDAKTMKAIRAALKAA